MKRSKILLGVTTCILAIAGVAATKAHRPAVKVFYIPAPNKCIAFTPLRSCTLLGSSSICKTVIGTGVYTLYTKLVSTLQNCVHPATYNAQ